MLDLLITDILLGVLLDPEKGGDALHGVTTQKFVPFIVTAVRTSDRTICPLVCCSCK
jgi:hypothetical protein